MSRTFSILPRCVLVVLHELSRPKPYDRPQRHSDRGALPGQECEPVSRDSFPSRRTDSSVVSKLFAQLVPIAVKEPLAFESKASTICASFNLDSAASADIINSVKQQFLLARNQETTCVVDSYPPFHTDVDSQRSSGPG